MNAWKKLLLCGAAAGLSSCAALNTENSHQQAQQRWSGVRSRVKYQVAAESFATGQLDEASKQLAEALALDPAMADGHILRTRILLERGEIAAAQEALNAAVRSGANSPETDYLAGIIAQRYGRLDEALSAYRRASNRDPGNAHYVVTVAETLVALDRPAEALGLIRRRWTDFEQSATLRATAGQLYLMLGQYEQAADVYREAVRISPDDVTLQYQLGCALVLADRDAEAVAVLEPVTRKPGETPGYILVALGRAYVGIGRTDQARSTLRQATEASPTSASAWTWLARAAVSCNDLLTARQAAGKAVEIERESADPAILLGYVCLRQRDPEAAIRALEDALRRRPDDPLAQHLLDQARALLKPPAEVRPTLLPEVNSP